MCVRVRGRVCVYVYVCVCVRACVCVCARRAVNDLPRDGGTDEEDGSRAYNVFRDDVGSAKQAAYGRAAQELPTMMGGPRGGSPWHQPCPVCGGGGPLRV